MQVTGGLEECSRLRGERGVPFRDRPVEGVGAARPAQDPDHLRVTDVGWPVAAVAGAALTARRPFNEKLQGMTADEIIAFVSSLPGVAAVTASEANGAPEAAWGDSFFFSTRMTTPPAAGCRSPPS